jgi:hypothetical protein
MTIRRRSLEALLRAVTAWVAVFALGAGVVAFHDPVSERPGAPERVEVEEAARHPHEPVHFEASALAAHPACVACLVQLQTGSTIARPAPAGPVLLTAGALVSPAARPVLSRVSSRLPARAPPSLSASL